jgi:hypothetical protein
VLQCCPGRPDFASLTWQLSRTREARFDESFRDISTITARISSRLFVFK